VAAKKTQGVKRKRNYDKKQNNKTSVKLSDSAVERTFNGYMTRSKRSRLANIEVNTVYCKIILCTALYPSGKI
jgi:hypothetical protein